MVAVTVYPGCKTPSHDISLSDGVLSYGLLFVRDRPEVLRDIPMTPSAEPFEITQRTGIGGRGRLRLRDDPTGFFDSESLWTMTNGKLFPDPKWKIGRGIRNCDSHLSDSLTWKKLIGGERFISVSFSASASYSADKGQIWLRRRGGSPGSAGGPGTLTFELCSDSADDPGTALQTVTKTSSNILDIISIFQLFDWTGTQALVASTTYHVKVYGASTDDDNNHWEVAVDAATSGSKKSSTGAAASWTATTYKLNFLITDANVKRKLYDFVLDGAHYLVSKNDDGTASKLFINGDRGKVASATSTTLVCTGKTWTTNRWAGAYVRIITGTGDGQVRQIVSNDATSLTVAAWDVTPDTTTYFVIYGNEWWTEIAGHGLTALSGPPKATGKIAYFPQGTGALMRRMRVYLSTYQFAADSGYADLLVSYTNKTNALLYMMRALVGTATIQAAYAQPWGTNLAFAATRYVGSSDYRITNMYVHNGQVHVFKEDGIYYLDNERPHQMGLDLASAADPENGIAAVTHDTFLYWNWGASVERTMGANTADIDNYKEGYDGLPDNRKGNAIALVSVIGWLFKAVDGGDSNYSSILCWNGFGWHEIFRGWAAGVRIRNAFSQSGPNMRPRLWVDIGGDLIYIDLPKSAANPLKDSTLPFMHEGVLTTSTIDAGEETFYKFLHSLKVITDPLGTTGSVEIDWQTNEDVGTNSWITLGSGINVSPFEEKIIDQGQILQSRLRLRLQSSSATAPAIVTAFGESGSRVAPIKYQWVGQFSVDSEQVTKTQGMPDHPPDEIVSWLLEKARTLDKLRMRSLVQRQDDKVVTILAPAIVSTWIGDGKWGGVLSIAIREV